MALFRNEAEKNGEPELAVKPQPSPVQAAPAPPPPIPERRLERPAPVSPSEACAYLDRGAKVSGKLSFEGPARVEGQVEGEIHAKDLVIGESAVVTAQINAASITIAGTVRGEVVATQRLEVRPSAKISGNITAPKLIVHEGAIFDGHCAMQGDGMREDRKLSAHRRPESGVSPADGQIQAR